MEHNESFYDQIEAFLAGRLAPEQREAMQKAMLESPELARELELRRLEFDVSEALIAQNIRDQLVRLRTSPSPEPPPPPVRAYKFHPLFWLIAALLSSAAIGVYWWNKQTTPTAPTTEQSPSSPPGRTLPVPDEAPIPDPPRAGNDPSGSDRRKTPGIPENQSARQQLALATALYQRPDMETIRGTAPTANDAYDLAWSAWEKQDFAAVITALQNFPANDPKWMRALTLRAHAQFNLKSFAQAAQSFSTVADGKIRPWSEEADWYLLLALLADGKADTAAFRTRLDKLLSDEGHPYFEQAKEVKARLGGR